MKKNLLLITLLTFVMAGCSGVEIKRVMSNDSSTTGLRFYRPYPYLLVTSEEGKTSLTVKVVYLPNLKEDYALSVTSRMGSVDAKFTLENGWNLTTYGAAIDPKTSEIISALTGSLKAVAGLPGLKAVEELRPGLYRLDFDEKTGLISGCTCVVQFK
jgi:hypothetical protein